MINSALKNIQKHGFLSWIKKIGTLLTDNRCRFNYHIRNLKTGLVSTKVAAHYGVWGFRNAGDTILFQEVERCFNKTFFWRRDISSGEIDGAEIEWVNKRVNYLVLGGGGLFLKDSNSNSNSNWQFNISIKNLEKLNVPLVLFAVGYNRFRDQDEFDAVFTPHLIKTVEKSVFVGLRNHGSIEAIKEYLPDNLKDKLIFQPCPTTIIKYNHPEYYKKTEILQARKKTVAINIAFDRHEKRFNGNHEKVFGSIIAVAEFAEKLGCKVVFVGHTIIDRGIQNYLNSKFDYVDLTFKSVDSICEFYSNVALTIGMRGHAQMVPFGLGNPIISLVSHNKMRWFLEDIGHVEWGVEIHDEAFETILKEKVESILSNFVMVRNQVSDAIDILKEVTDKNISFIEKSLQ